MLPIVRILRGQFVLAIVLGLLTGPMVGCISKLEGVDFDDKLMLKEDGLVYRKGDDKPFTGKGTIASVVTTVCPSYIGRVSSKTEKSMVRSYFQNHAKLMASFIPMTRLLSE
jgi:hypothetical protein